jgi:hypothetical protein
MVIKTTRTGCPSAVATHWAHMVSFGFLSNPMIVSRSSRKAPTPARHECLFDARAGNTLED